MNTKDFCEYCNAELPEVEKSVTVFRKRRGRIFVIENVPARVCPRCGERYFIAQVIRAMEKLMDAPRAAKQTISVPVIAFAPSK